MTTQTRGSSVPQLLERDVETPNGRVFVTGMPGEDPPIVLLHGFPDDHRIYSELLARLSPRRAVAFDFAHLTAPWLADGLGTVFTWVIARPRPPARAQPGDPPATSYDHSSLLIPTEGCAGPPARSAAERCPCPNAGDWIQAWNASSSRHRVTTSQVARPSVGLSSSNPSNPSWLSTAPARAANLRASSSPLSAGTVIALILTTVMP